MSHLFKKDKDYILDNFLPDSINYIKQFEKEKSPRKKLLEINNLLLCIHNLVKFNGQELEGVDDEISLLNFTIIKSKPERIYTICEYVKFLLGNKIHGGLEDNLLTKLNGACEYIRKLSFNELSNIYESDYIQNCEMVLQGILY